MDVETQFDTSYRKAIERAFPAAGHACVICDTLEEEVGWAAAALEFGLEQGCRGLFASSKVTSRRVLHTLGAGPIGPTLSRPSAFFIVDAPSVTLEMGLAGWERLLEPELRAHGGLCVVVDASRLFDETFCETVSPDFERMVYQLFRAHAVWSLAIYNRTAAPAARLLRGLSLHPVILSARGPSRNPLFQPESGSRSGDGGPELPRLLGVVEEHQRLQAQCDELSANLDHLLHSEGVLLQYLDEAGRIAEVSQGWASRLGYSRADMAGCQLDVFLSSSCREAVLPELLSRIAERAPVRHEPLEFRCKDGRLLQTIVRIESIEAAAGEGRLCMVLEDVTAQLSAAYALEVVTGKFHVLLGAIGEGVIETDAEGMIVHANHAAAQMLGCTPEDLTGQPFQTIMPQVGIRGRDSAVLNREPAEKWFEGKIHRAGNAEFRCKGGGVLKVDYVSRPLLDGNAVTGSLIIFSHTSGHPLLEAQLRQSQKMDAIGRLAGGVAHDFNNLLTAILGTSELLRNQLSGQPALVKSIEEIRRAADRAAALTQQLLAFSRRQVMQPRTLDLNSVVREMDKLLRRVISERVELNTELAARLWPVKADPHQTEQVLLNLCINARDAMPDGGTLWIRTRNAKLTRQDVMGRAGLSPGAYVVVEVTDTGTGIAKEQLNHIFEPFYTTKPEGLGTGLGLSMVYGIVKQSSGYVEVESAPQHGATFRIYLPRAEGRPQRLRISRAQAPPTPGTKTVLVVEDEEVVRNLVDTILRSSGYDVLTAEHGENALELAERFAGQLDLVLTDVVMPGMGGREVAERLQAMCPGIRVLYMSGHTEDAFVHEGLIDPDIPFLRKPFRPEELTQKVREVLGESNEE